MTEFHYCWEWRFRSSPERLWPLVADTNRFNRDAGVPELELGEVRRGGRRPSPPAQAGIRSSGTLKGSKMSASKSGRSAKARNEPSMLGAFMSVVAFLIERS
jgi:hypothetical protein